MKIENNLTVDEEDFSAIEEHYGCTLDAGLRRFITQYNGIIEGPEYGVDIEYKSFSGRTITDSFCEILHTQTILKMLPRLGFINDFLMMMASLLHKLNPLRYYLFLVWPEGAC